MSATLPSVNGRLPRKTLATQIDRLDGILDGLAEALNESVEAAVRHVVAQAVREAVTTALAEASVRPAPQPEPSTSAAAPDLSSKLVTWRQRLRQGLLPRLTRSQQRLRAGVSRWFGFLGSVKAHLLRIRESSQHQLSCLWQERRRWAGILGMGVLAGTSAYLAGPLVASAGCAVAGSILAHRLSRRTSLTIAQSQN